MRRNIFSSPLPQASSNAVLMEYGITAALVIVVLIGALQIFLHFV